MPWAAIGIQTTSVAAAANVRCRILGLSRKEEACFVRTVTIKDLRRNAPLVISPSLG